ncbi:hypothetical protein ACMDB5_00390 [Flavobacterium sp. W1B]|uniref:hypothetical protein n=1 Tax=Flavobacterium sp. W1B TaxID=3394146 RepID=UPI0039BC6917
MNNIPQNILVLLLAYTSKEISESEFCALKEWINESSENEKFFSEYLLFYKKSRRIAFLENTDKDKAWNNIVSQLERPLQSIEISEKPESKIRFLKQASTVFKYAAVILFFYQ